MELSKEQIEEINSKCPYNQGIFFQPYGIPVDVKELVVYCRYETGGIRGGSCWGNENRRSYVEEPPKDRMKVLELVLEVIKPSVTFLQYRQLESLIRNNEESDREYYGNCTDWKIEYIVLSELIEKLESF